MLGILAPRCWVDRRALAVFRDVVISLSSPTLEVRHRRPNRFRLVTAAQKGDRRFRPQGTFNRSHHRRDHQLSPTSAAAIARALVDVYQVV